MREKLIKENLKNLVMIAGSMDLLAMYVEYHDQNSIAEFLKKNSGRISNCASRIRVELET